MNSAFVGGLPGAIDADTRALLDELAEALAAKRRRNLLRTSYYEQKKLPKQATDIMPPHYSRLGLVLGWPSKAVDLLQRRCNLDAMTWADGDIGSLGISAIEESEMSEFAAAQTDSLIHGVSFLVNVAGGAGEPLSQIHSVSALEGTGQYSERRRRLENLLSVTAREDGRISAFVLYLPGRTLTCQRVGGRWECDSIPTGWSELLVEALPYKPRPGRRFGRSRITRAVMSLSDASIRTLIRLEGHLDVYSYPELWLLGADMSAFSTADGSMMDIFKARLGRIKAIPDDEHSDNPRADVKSFPAADPTPHLAGLNAIAKLMAREAQLPDSALAISDVANPTSAESYDASQYEMIAEAEGAVKDWQGPISRTVQRALAILGGLDSVPESWKTIRGKWRDPRYLSRAAQADAGTKQLSAVPWLADTTVGLELLGLTQTQIDRAIAERRRERGRRILEAAGIAGTPRAAGPEEP